MQPLPTSPEAVRPGGQGEEALTWPDDAALVNSCQAFKLYPGTVLVWLIRSFVFSLRAGSFTLTLSIRHPCEPWASGDASASQWPLSRARVSFS
jgi:hypothetical protein